MNLFTSPLTPCIAFSEVSSRETGNPEIQVMILSFSSSKIEN